eukprot:5992472-Pyramimonas_sp.AAC.1
MSSYSLGPACHHTALHVASPYYSRAAILRSRHHDTMRMDYSPVHLLPLQCYNAAHVARLVPKYEKAEKLGALYLFYIREGFGLFGCIICYPSPTHVKITAVAAVAARSATAAGIGLYFLSPALSAAACFASIFLRRRSCGNHTSPARAADPYQASE